MPLRGLYGGGLNLGAFLRYWLPWCAYLGLIFGISGLSRPEEDFGISVSDWLAHLGEYFILLGLTFRAFRKAGWQDLKTRYFFAGIVFCLFFAASDELHQFFVPGRNCDIRDFLFDAAGTLAGAVIYKVMKEPDLP